jgi:hypothetical protein
MLSCTENNVTSLKKIKLNTGTADCLINSINNKIYIQIKQKKNNKKGRKIKS